MSRAATLSTGRNRVALGRDLRLLDVSAGVIWLEGTLRLRPGQAIDLVGAWPGLAAPHRARVVTWRVVRLSDVGPHYRGSCRLEA